MWEPVLSDGKPSVLHCRPRTLNAGFQVKDRSNQPSRTVANSLVVTLLIFLSTPLFLGGLVAAGELGDGRLLALGTLALIGTSALVLGAPKWNPGTVAQASPKHHGPGASEQSA